MWCCCAGLRTLHIWSACNEFVYDLPVEVLACLTRLTNLQELVVHQEQQGPLGSKAVKLQFMKKASIMFVGCVNPVIVRKLLLRLPLSATRHAVPGRQVVTQYGSRISKAQLATMHHVPCLHMNCSSGSTQSRPCGATCSSTVRTSLEARTRCSKMRARQRLQPLKVTPPQDISEVQQRSSGWWHSDRWVR
jgi:hypothetical protein